MDGIIELPMEDLSSAKRSVLWEWSDASRGREVVVVLAKRMQPRKMGWLEERHRLNQRYYRGEIDIDTYLRELAKIAKKERDRERRSIELAARERI